MADDIVQIVDSVASSPTVLLDLNDSSSWLTTYDSDLTPPPLNVAETSNMMTDGGFISAESYPNRTLKLALEVAGSTADARALEVQKIARLLDRPHFSNYLKWQPGGATNPVFFPLFRSSFDSIKEISGGGLREIALSLKAKPHGVGLVETLTSATVNFDPAAGSNPCWFEIAGSALKGDVDTPLQIISADAQFVSQVFVLATRRRGTPSNVTWFRQAESLTGITDMSNPGNDATASGSGSNYARCSFATPTSALRLTGPFPASTAGNPDWRGTYRVIARIRHSVSADVIKLKLRTGNTASDQGPTQLRSTTGWQLYDLGLVQIPGFSSATARFGLYGAEQTPDNQDLSIYAERTSGSGNMDVDYIFLAPADADLAFVQAGNDAASGGNVVIDGLARAVYRRSSTNEVLSSVNDLCFFDGRLPRIDPRATTNRVFVLPGFTNNATGAVAVGDSASLTLQYYPLYRYVRPAST